MDDGNPDTKEQSHREEEISEVPSEIVSSQREEQITFYRDDDEERAEEESHDHSMNSSDIGLDTSLQIDTTIEAPLDVRMGGQEDGTERAVGLSLNHKTPTKSNVSDAPFFSKSGRTPAAESGQRENDGVTDPTKNVTFETVPAGDSFDHASYSADSSTDGGNSSTASIQSLTDLDAHRVVSLGDPAPLRTLRRQQSATVVQKNRRLSFTVDLETGKMGARSHRFLLRNTPTNEPQTAGARRRRGSRNSLTNAFFKSPLKEDGNEADDEDPAKEKTALRGRLLVRQKGWRDRSTTGDEEQVLQYRMEATSPKQRHAAAKFANFINPHFSIYEENLGDDKDNCGCIGIRPNHMVIRYLNWAFRSAFPVVLLSGAVVFFSLTIVFAILIYIVGLRKPNCVHVNGEDFDDPGAASFLDAYALSWTTFSTVGYGLVYPSTSATSYDIRDCTGITVLTTLESFVGILFASLCGAIVFAKVARSASFAQVTFSDPIVIRYGGGLLTHDEDDDEEEGSGQDGKSGPQEFVQSKIPCPLLEFRVYNRLHKRRGGEIIDATMNIVASIDESQASSSLKNAIRGARRKGKKGKRRGGRRVLGRRMGSREDSMRNIGKADVERKLERVRELITAGKNQRVVEDPTGKLSTNTIFAKLDFESQEHPFFKRLWLARHVIDHHSPLLKQEVKELVRIHGGHWPAELNNPEAVRASIHFDQILVSLSGTSNVDANSVYAQKVYDYVDLCVGFRFCNMLYRETDGSVGVDGTLLNDVTEQYGGGGEDLEKRAKANSNDIVIL